VLRKRIIQHETKVECMCEKSDNGDLQVRQNSVF